MAFDLAKNRINLLNITQITDDTYAIGFEYQYINHDKSRVWQKDILVFDDTFLDELHDAISDRLVDYVTQARAELEK